MTRSAATRTTPGACRPGAALAGGVRRFNQLPEPVRKKIGTENVARIYGKTVAPDLTGKHGRA